MIPYSRQSIDQSDIDAVVGVLRSDYLTQGPAVGEFEKSLAEATGNSFAVAVSSATAALHIACLAIGVTQGDVVWTSPVSFVATANCAVYCGAEVDFVDIDPRTFNICHEQLAIRLRAAERVGKLPKVLIPVHLGGNPAEMPEIEKMCREFGVQIIQDASHALGATLCGESILSPRFGDVAVTSFHPVKMITSAEGGAALTNSSELAGRMARLRSHGITRAPREMTQPPHGPWYYEQIELGFNYRMTDMYAALGSSQLKRLDEFVSRRNQVARLYQSLLDEDLYRLQLVPPGRRSSYHLMIAIPNYARLRCSQLELFERLRSRGVVANLHYIPIYRHPYHRALRGDQPDCPVAEWYYRNALSIPCFSAMLEAEVIQVVNALTQPVGHQTIF